jgi:hypothetical protein
VVEVVDVNIHLQELKMLLVVVEELVVIEHLKQRQIVIRLVH